MKILELTVEGNRYAVKLEDELVDFVIEDLAKSDVSVHKDNKADRLLKAYLHLANQTTSYEDEIELLIETLDSM